MRIMVLVGGMPVFTDSLSEDLKLRREYLMRFASPGTEIEVVPTNPVGNRPQGEPLELAAVETAVKGEKDGFDAIAIHNGWNRGVVAVREAVGIPVIGGAESMFHAACLIANKIGVVTANDIEEPVLLKSWSAIGIDHSRITSVRFTDVPHPDTVKRKDELWDEFIEFAKKQIDEEGAQAIIPACLAWMPVFELYIAPDAKEQLEGILGVPVMHTSALLVKFAEVLANLKVVRSKKAHS